MSGLGSQVTGLIDDVIHLRRDIHRHPEPGFEETRTQERIRKSLESEGLSCRPCAGTGLLVDIGQGQGKTIALRADMDCLRMTEENQDLPWASERPGLAHMCGHDGHTAALVGAGRLLARASEQISGGVRLIFQPAEEGPGGAPKMIDEGALDSVDEVYGMHNWPTVPLGEMRTIVGPCMATVAEFTCKVIGRGGHASQPQDAIDPLLTVAQIVNALQSIVSRNVHYQERAVVSVTKIQGGEVFNVIPETATFMGTIRALSDQVYELIERRFEGIVEGVATAMGARAELKIKRMYPVVVNTLEETGHVQEIGAEIYGAENVSSKDLPMLGAEDFAYFLHERPGCFFFLGGAEEGRTNAMCHAPDYDFNDKLLDPAIRFWLRLVEHRLGVELL